MITDRLVHPPPERGDFAYNTFSPSVPTFPKLGKFFTDPIFGSDIRRLTAEFPKASESDIYSRNGCWNANGRRFVHNTPTGRVIIDTTTGKVVRTKVPGTYDGSFDPVDPDRYWYFAGAQLRYMEVTAGITHQFHVLPRPLDALGGSVDWISANGRYMVLNLDGQGRVFDRETKALYAGAIPGDAGDGWLGISPDGRYVVSTSIVPNIEGVGQPLHSYAIDHDARRLATTGVMFWSLCGSHGDLISPGDGKTYLVTTECHSEPGLWLVDVSRPQKSDTPEALAKQRADARKLLAASRKPEPHDDDWDWRDNDGHISCGGVWAYASIESTDDPHGGDVDDWRPYKGEILRVHVLTGEVQRLAHHRSRGIGGSYYSQPRVCARWDGSGAAWASNFGYQAPDYGDIWSVVVGAGVITPPVEPPVKPPPVPPPPPPPGPLVDTTEIIVGGKVLFKRV